MSTAVQEETVPRRAYVSFMDASQPIQLSDEPRALFLPSGTQNLPQDVSMPNLAEAESPRESLIAMTDSPSVLAARRRWSLLRKKKKDLIQEQRAFGERAKVLNPEMLGLLLRSFANRYLDMDNVKRQVDERLRHKQSITKGSRYVMVLVFFFTLVLLQARIARVNSLESTLSQYFTGSDVYVVTNDSGLGGNVEIPAFSDLQSFEDILLWIEHPFINLIMPAQQWYNGQTFSEKELGYLIKYNKLVGGFRVAQRRTDSSMEGAASRRFKNYYPIRFPNFSSKSQSKTAFGPKHDPEKYFFQGTDDSGAFRVDFPNDPKKAKLILQELRQDLFLDKNTREINIECVVYNGNLEVFTQISLFIGFYNTGKVMTDLRLSSFRLEYYLTTEDFVRLGFEVICSLYRAYIQLCTINVLLCLAKGLEYMGNSESYGVLVKTIQHAGPQLFKFMVVWSITILCFAVMGMVTFGGRLEEWSNLWSCVETLHMMVTGEYGYEPLTAVSAVYAAIFYILFLIVVFFLLVNILLAIMMESYSELLAIRKKEETKIKETNIKVPVIQEIVHDFVNRFHWLVPMKVVAHFTIAEFIGTEELRDLLDPDKFPDLLVGAKLKTPTPTLDDPTPLPKLFLSSLGVTQCVQNMDKVHFIMASFGKVYEEAEFDATLLQSEPPSAFASAIASPTARDQDRVFPYGSFKYHIQSESTTRSRVNSYLLSG
ncbi:hypothetical protein CYMTET_17254 [Cymbomonas tetramitiformis]|uniref:Polycystin cation channel PKD1/PKD2 domain-containing protein n=1 Tax=Cymbomonas tetramitiformis TaxID=36881 RepID=A0AAE0GAH1_9CHLO|nr:hypothetical protein CYMTET_17254 [Cymbomonas tetramitiformis]